MTFIDTTAAVTVAILRRYTGGQSTAGDYVETTVTVADNVRADIQPRRGDIARAAAGDVIRADYVMYTATYLSATIAEHDEVISGAQSYEVVAVFDWRDHYELLLQSRRLS